MQTALTKTLQRLRDVGGLEDKDIANIVAVSPATVSQWSTGKALPSLRAQRVIAALDYIVERLSDFYAPDEIRLWLYAEHQMLEGERAIDLINGDKIQYVLAVIDALDTGIYS